jgi:hypothetical protein
MSAAAVAARKFYKDRVHVMRARTAIRQVNQTVQASCKKGSPVAIEQHDVDDGEIRKLVDSFMQENPELANALAEELFQKQGNEERERKIPKRE